MGSGSRLVALLLSFALCGCAGETCTNKTDSQCGGKDFKGTTCCPTGLKCTYRNEWFSKCMTSSPTPTSSSCSNKLDSQCGGVSYKGNTCCPSGLKCTYRNEWFSKCMTSTVPTPTTKPTTSKPTSSTCSNKLDSQCGGVSYKGTTCCPSGLKCTYRNEWFSKCMASTVPTPTTKPTTSKPTTSTCSNKLDSQCGGVNYTGNKCCPSGLTCTYRNEWFSKCMAGGAPTPTTKPTTAKPTSSTCSNKLDSQCGGLNYTGNKCCPSGLTCTVRNEWFSKCMAGSPTPTVKPTTSQPTTTKPYCTDYGACGWPDKWICDGGKACPDNRVCTFKDGRNLCLCKAGFIGDTCDTSCAPGSVCGAKKFNDSYYGYPVEPSFCCNIAYATICGFDGGSGGQVYYCSDSRLQTCDPNPCKNGGRCASPERGTDARCDCPPEWSGTLCETPASSNIKKCKEGTCNYGTCHEPTTTGGDVTCTCPYPYTGVTCDSIVGKYDCAQTETACGYSREENVYSNSLSNYADVMTYDFTKWTKPYSTCCRQYYCREQYTYKKFPTPALDTAYVFRINYESKCIDDLNYIYTPPPPVTVYPVTTCEPGVCFNGTCKQSSTPGQSVTCTCPYPYSGSFCQDVEGASACTSKNNSPCGHVTTEYTTAFSTLRKITSPFTTCCLNGSDKPNCFGDKYETLSAEGDTMRITKVTHTCQ